MTVREFFDNPLFIFPAKPANYFPGHLSQSFEVYQGLVASIDDENKEFVDKFQKDIANSCRQILLITECYFEGKLLMAYKLFSELVSHFGQYVLQKNKNAVRTDLDSHLFKARSNLQKDYNVQDMFHIPFENRYTRKTNRFSLSGLPCLYLANSVYACWEELERPLFAQMAVSRFETYQKNFKYLDLSVDLWYLQHAFGGVRPKEREKDYLKKADHMALEKFLQLFPLYIACYTGVFNKHADFKPEYIFPQMLMEWIVNTDWIDGVVYESTQTARLKISGGMPNLKDALNFALPVRSNAEAGFCKILSKNLRLTRPTSWEMVSLLKPEVASRPLDLKNDILGKVPAPPILNFNIQNEENLRYYETVFGRFEHYLFSQPTVGFS